MIHIAGNDKARKYKLRFPEHWYSTLNPTKLDLRKEELNKFFSEFCAWTTALADETAAAGENPMLRQLFGMPTLG